MYDLSLLNISISITNNTLLTEPTFYVTTPGRGCCRYAHPPAGCTLFWAVTVALVPVSSVLHHSTTSKRTTRTCRKENRYRNEDCRKEKAKTNESEIENKLEEYE